MPEYLSTREVARYLKLNQKKIYAMVAAGELPAARISGKWLFPRELIDQWVASHTLHPATGLMGALLDEMVVLQGSDDWLLLRIIDRFHKRRETAVPTTAVGSVAGLMAVAAGRAHVASCHVDLPEVKRHLGSPASLYNLYTREQGLIYDRERSGRIGSLRTVARRGLRFAERQEGSGTYRLVRRLLAELGAEASWQSIGPFTTHLEVAVAVLRGDADVGLGARIAAEMVGLDFTPLATESFDLLVPASYASHPSLATFLEFTFDEIDGEAARHPAGYSFSRTGRVQPLAPSKPIARSIP